MRSRRAEDGAHAWTLAVQARWGLRWRVRLGSSVVVIVVVSFGVVVLISRDGPRRGVDHGDPSPVDLCLAHVAVSGLRPCIEDFVTQDGVGCGRLSRLRPPEEQESALGRVSAPGVTC